MDISWDDVKLFLITAQSSSLSAAARQLNVGQATVSRRVARLEESLGCSLIQRNTDGVSLTTSGQNLLLAAQSMASSAELFVQTAQTHSDNLAGIVRITTAPGAAVDILAPFAAELKQTHPQIHIEIISTIDYMDLSKGQADIALRRKEPTNNELMTVSSAFLKMGAYGSNDYISTLPSPCHLSDLRWVGWSAQLEGTTPENWLKKNIPNFSATMTSNSFIVQEKAASCGIGAILLPKAQAKLNPDLNPIEVVDAQFPMTPVFVVVSKSGWKTARIQTTARLFVQWLSEIIESRDE